MLTISQRALNIKPSPTFAVLDKAQAMQKEGIDVISLSTGEPDFCTPRYIKDAGIAAIEEDFSRYTSPAGTLELRAAICDKFSAENGLSYQPKQVVASAGAKQALTNAVFAVCNPGDEVLIPYPCYVSYGDVVSMAGGVPVFVPTEEKDNFHPNLAALKEKITPRTKAIIINSPNNPTGCTYSQQDLEGLAELALRHQFYIIADEIYEKLVYDGVPHLSIGAISPEVSDQTITINGVSKSFAMTGWRIGYSASTNTKLSQAMSSLQSHATSCPNSIAQKAALAALLVPSGEVELMVRNYDERRLNMMRQMQAMKYLTCRRPEGAFYIMGNISQTIGMHYHGETITGSQSFAQLLLEKGRVAVVPGVAFGPEGDTETDTFVRFAYALDNSSINESMRRLSEFLNELQA